MIIPELLFGVFILPWPCTGRTLRAVELEAQVDYLTTVALLRGTIVNRTYVLHKNLYISPFLLTIFGPINYGPP